jgi:hypothetical protein
VTSRHLLVLALAVGMVTAASACSADRVTIPAERAPTATEPYRTGSPRIPAPPTATDTAALRAVDRDDGSALTTDVVLQNNTIVVEPVAAGAQAAATVNLATARATTRIDANTPRSAPLTCRIGVLSQTVDGQLRVDHRPVWMCFQVGVPIATTLDGPPVPTNTVTFVDSTTGEWLFTNENPA